MDGAREAGKGAPQSPLLSQHGSRLSSSTPTQPGLLVIEASRTGLALSPNSPGWAPLYPFLLIPGVHAPHPNTHP